MHALFAFKSTKPPFQPIQYTFKLGAQNTVPPPGYYYWIETTTAELEFKHMYQCGGIIGSYHRGLLHKGDQEGAIQSGGECVIAQGDLFLITNRCGSLQADNKNADAIARLFTLCFGKKVDENKVVEWDHSMDDGPLQTQLNTCFKRSTAANLAPIVLNIISRQIRFARESRERRQRHSLVANAVRSGLKQVVSGVIANLDAKQPSHGPS